MRRGRPTRRHGRVDLGRGRGGGGTAPAERAREGSGASAVPAARTSAALVSKRRRSASAPRGEGARRRWRRSSRGWRSRVGARAPRAACTASATARVAVITRGSAEGMSTAAGGNEGGEERSGAARVEDARRREPRRWRTRMQPSDARKKRRLDLFLSRADNRGICRLVEGRAEREGATATARRGGTDEETRGERVRRARSRRLSVWRALPEPLRVKQKSPPSESDPWVDPVDEEKC